ncbi:hypothetical protein TCDM_13291 [Trypanosoma cruzi Dm28c]|uniref:Uncharacterized protein n=1 Tax=Trypanosoma cruzi Dm28c TaxID=1416333 RepID=V5ANN2_TRYCR|nr:hypothetical protein TCDM_13291 [Trypanosoma cruzi Dm28c]
MLGLCRSLSLPSLLLPLDPVTPRRLCVQGAFTAATRESIQICVCGRCVCCWSFQCLAISQWRLALDFLPSVCVHEAEKRENKPSKEVRQRAPPPIHTVSGIIIPAAVTPNNNNSRTQTHGRTVHRKHTATATTSSSRSHGGCLICHASAHAGQNTHIKQQAGCKRTIVLRKAHALSLVILQLPPPKPTRYYRSFYCCPSSASASAHQPTQAKNP